MATKHELIAQAEALGLTVPASATKAEVEAFLKSRTAPPPGAPLEVDAERLMVQRPAGPFRGGVILNAKGRCAICDGVGDHSHTFTTADAPGATVHEHRDEPPLATGGVIPADSETLVGGPDTAETVIPLGNESDD